MHDDITEYLLNEMLEDEDPGVKDAVYSVVIEHLEHCLKAQYWPAESHYCLSCGCALRMNGRNARACLNCNYRGGK